MILIKMIILKKSTQKLGKNQFRKYMRIKDQGIFQFLVNLKVLDHKIDKGESNSFNLQVEMKVNLNSNPLKHQDQRYFFDWSNQHQCNLRESVFSNVYISGANLNGALLFNFIWNNQKCRNYFKLDGHNDYVLSICFSPDSYQLVSCRKDNSIHLWNIRTGKKITQLNSLQYDVYSICFSLNGTTLESIRQDSFIFQVMLRQEKNYVNQNVITKFQIHQASLLMVKYQLLMVQISQLVYWMQKRTIKHNFRWSQRQSSINTLLSNQHHIVVFQWRSFYPFMGCLKKANKTFNYMVIVY
ncbi:unnamed protein product [Paramecium primaurelia]|uniref:Uncharacterized protein n=1 Tax=Paramecium primaurelia TaxID=5886 RepID=A0A8S1NIX8_PARPR|nr:unnamed protein product [Paramecium primaurelia]